jgi:hypothetical protein
MTGRRADLAIQRHPAGHGLHRPRHLPRSDPRPRDMKKKILVLFAQEWDRAEPARLLPLPGTDPHAVVLVQHKYYSRRAQRAIAPEATPRFFAFPYDLEDPGGLELPFPLFVTPAKATVSVLARPVQNFEELRRHLSFAPFEELIIRRLVKPFNDLAVGRNGFRLDAHHIVGEEIVDGIRSTWAASPAAAASGCWGSWTS